MPSKNWWGLRRYKAPLYEIQGSDGFYHPLLFDCEWAAKEHARPLNEVSADGPFDAIRVRVTWAEPRRKA